MVYGLWFVVYGWSCSAFFSRCVDPVEVDPDVDTLVHLHAGVGVEQIRNLAVKSRINILCMGLIRGFRANIYLAISLQVHNTSSRKCDIASLEQISFATLTIAKCICPSKELPRPQKHAGGRSSSYPLCRCVDTMTYLEWLACSSSEASSV